MLLIQYQIGDATEPKVAGNKIIVHICNNLGYWNKGFVCAISKKWIEPKRLYHSETNLKLGDVQLVKVEKDIWVFNMIAQQGIRTRQEPTPIRYEALRECLQQLCKVAQTLNASVHMPRIGCGLAGGKWEIVEPIIDEELTSKDVPVFVYDLP